LPPGWRHVAAVKQGGVLRLYVEGKAIAESARFDATKYDLTADVPLLIGAGAGDSFNGTLADVRLYRRALSAAEIGRLVKP
jgi:hypothetical protein